MTVQSQQGISDQRMCIPAYRSDLIKDVSCGPGGAFCLNGAKSYEKWYEGGFLGTGNTFPAPVPANGTSILTFRASTSDNNAGDVSLSQLLGTWTDRRLAAIVYSQWLDRAFSNVAVPVEMLFGTPNFPALIAGTLYVATGTALTAETTDFSGSTNNASLLGRGFRNLIQDGQEAVALLAKQNQWNKYRSFQPFILGPDLGPFLPQNATLGAGQSITLTYTCPSASDFYMFAPYVIVTDGAGNNVPLSTGTGLSITQWTEGGSAASFIDPATLPLDAALVFAQNFNVTGWGPDNTVRVGTFPGGWGGNIWNDEGQWTHRLHHGTVMQITLMNNLEDGIQISMFFPGYLAVCQRTPGQGSLALPQQAMSTPSPIMQMTPPPVGVMVPGTQGWPGHNQRFMPSRNQLRTQGQGW